MACPKHPRASAAGEFCQVCLLEQALVSAPARELVVHVPLGHGVDTAVFIVRQEAPTAALLRLKVWRRPAPDAFLDGVTALIECLQAHTEQAIIAPLAACLDDAGCPAVLSTFRQGVPILSAVKSGALACSAALELLDSLGPVLDRCHRRGIAHGSIVAGNVLVDPAASSVFVVDFGLSQLTGRPAPGDAPAADRAGLAAIEQALRSSAATLASSTV